MRSLPKVASIRVVALAALLGLTAQGAAAQTGENLFGSVVETPPDTSIVRFALGFGAGSLGSDAEGGIAVRAGLTLSKWQAQSITLRSSIIEEFDLWGPTPAESVWDVGALYGRQTRGKWGYASASAGLALVGGMRRGERLSPPVQCGGYGLEALGCALAAAFTPVEHAEEPFHTMGVPLELEAGINLSRGFGLGLSAFANVNPERSVLGATFSVVFGRLR